MSAAKYDLIAEQGSGISLTLVYKESDGTTPIDISNGTPRIRVTDNEFDETSDTFTGTFTTDGTDGSFSIGVTTEQVEALGFRSGRYVIEVVRPALTETLVYGKLQIRELKY